MEEYTNNHYNRARALRREYFQGLFSRKEPDPTSLTEPRRQGLNQLLNLYLRRAKRMSEALFISVVTAQHNLKGNFHVEQLKNGIISTSAGYYRLARDVRNGRLVLYFSRAQKYLQPDTSGRGFLDEAIDEDGKIIPHAFRYQIASLPPYATKDHVREILRKHYLGFLNTSNFRMRLIGGAYTELNSDTKPTDKGYKKYETYAFGNSDLSLSVHEYPHSKWQLKIQAPIETTSDTPQIVDSESLRIRSNRLNELITSTRMIREFDTKEDALTYQFLMGNQRSQRIWNGQTANPIKENIFSAVTNATYNFSVGEYKNEENVQEGQVDATVTLGTAIITTIATAGAIGWRIFGITNLVKMIGGALTSGFVMRKVVAGYKRVTLESNWILPWKKGIETADPVDGLYRLNTRLNYNRTVNHKPNTKRDHFLHILDGSNTYDGFDVTYDTEDQKDPDDTHWKENWLLTFSAKAFGGFVSNIDDNTATDYSYNGLIRLCHRDPETQELIFYVKYVEALDINDKIAIPSEIKEMLTNDNIVRISRKKGKEAKPLSARSTKADMIYEMCPKLFQTKVIGNDRARNNAEDHLKWLFKNITVPSDADNTKAISLKVSSDPILAAKQTGNPSYQKDMKKLYGDDWEEMDKKTDKVVGIREFMKGASFPDIYPTVKPHMRAIKPKTIAHKIQRLIAA